MATAARSLSKLTLEPEGLRDLVQGRFVDALGTVAAQMSMDEMQERRGDYSKAVKALAEDTLSQTGLELEAVSLTGLDQADLQVFNPSNAFDAEADAISVLPSVRQVVHDLDASLPLSNVATVEELYANSLDTPRYLTILVSAFAVVALILSIIGIYGVMSYFVQQRTRDIGIRIALGGGRSNVIRMIVGQGMRLVGVGVVLGIGGAIFLTRYMSSVLFEVGTTDVITFATVSVVMLGIALLACFVPARRAATLDPAMTLRDE